MTDDPEKCENCEGRGWINPGLRRDPQNDKDCPICHGTGAVDAATSEVDPSCPVCDGEGTVPSEHGEKFPYSCPECQSK